MKEYVIYRFPNLWRPWQPNAYGKVGVRQKITHSGYVLDIELVNRNLHRNICKWNGIPYEEPDLSGMIILEEFIGTKAQALEKEKEWQIFYGCLDHTFSEDTREKMRQKKLGVSRADFTVDHKEHMKEGSALMEKPTCEVCGKTMKLNLFRAWKHGPQCKQVRK